MRLKLLEMFAAILHHTRGHPAAFQRSGLGKAPEGNSFEAMRKNHENISCQGPEQMTRVTSTCEQMTESTFTWPPGCPLPELDYVRQSFSGKFSVMRWSA